MQRDPASDANIERCRLHVVLGAAVKRRFLFDEAVNQQLAFKPSREHEVSRRLLAACRGDLRVRIGEVTHDNDGKGGLPRTPCGIRWVPNIMVPPTFPQGIPTEDETDCMTCLVVEASL